MSKYRKIKRVELSEYGRSGVILDFYPKIQQLSISGFYDSFCSSGTNSYTLREFFDMMGITQEDCNKAFLVVDKEDPSL